MEDVDLRLLETIAHGNSNEAASEFYNRYKNFLFNVCKKGCSNFDGGEHLAEDIFQNTMLKALKGIKSLYSKISGTKSDVSKIIKAWLVVISRNELREYLRKNPDENYLSNPHRIKSNDVINISVEMEINESQELDTEEVKPFYKEKLDQALSLLADREKHILMVYMQYYDYKQPHRHLPEDVIHELCIQYNITVENLRKIKGRALKKLMDKLNN